MNPMEEVGLISEVVNNYIYTVEIVQPKCYVQSKMFSIQCSFPQWGGLIIRAIRYRFDASNALTERVDPFDRSVIYDTQDNPVVLDGVFIGDPSVSVDSIWMIYSAVDTQIRLLRIS